MKTIFEYKPENKTWVLVPTVMLFLSDSKNDYTGIDLTFAWLCFGFSFRFKSK